MSTRKEASALFLQKKKKGFIFDDDDSKDITLKATTKLTEEIGNNGCTGGVRT